MEIILKEYVKGLGEKGDLVSVKPGFARNYLIPQGIAMMATKSARKMVEENMRQAAHRKQHLHDEAVKQAEKLAELTLVIETLAGADGKLFGSVTPLMVANALAEKGFEVDRKRISLPAEIKEIGSYTFEVDVLKDVKATVKMEVVAHEK
ncbi:MAG: 50S ribosomal protein L9 [Bacteroidia bacterium]|nr:50S ribosomal protein L9 [Bacteroidia bacterium]